MSTRSWPRTPGSIVTSKIDRQYAGTGTYQNVPVIEYEFPYKKLVFRSSHWRVGNYASGIREEAETIISHYPAGSTVTVFVNAKEPAKSVLEHGTSPLSWMLIVFGIILIALALLPFIVE
jgi:hypothetical protein